MRLFLSAATLAACCLPTPAGADIITFEHDVPPLYGGLAGAFATIPFTPFDPALGTLNSILLEFVGEIYTAGVITAEVSLRVRGERGEEPTEWFQPEVRIADPWAVLEVQSPPTGELNYAPFGYSYVFDSATDLVGLAHSQPLSGPVLSAPILHALRSDFVIAGPGPFPGLDVSVNTLESEGSVDGVYQIFLTVRATYDYTPAAVPEPTSAWLLGTGTLVVAVAGRRRARSSGRR